MRIPRVNVRVLFFSILLASVFWLLNAFNKSYTTRLDLPIQWHYEHEGLVTVKPLPRMVELNLTGVGWDLLNTKNWLRYSKPLIVSLPRPTATQKIERTQLRTILYDQLQPLQLNYVASPPISVDIQERISRVITLKLDTSSLFLADGRRVSSPMTLSEEVFMLTGARNYVQDHPNVYILRFDSTQKVDETFKKITIPITLDHEKVLETHPSEVDVFFRVKHYIRKNIVVPVELINSPRRGRYQALLAEMQLQLTYTVDNEHAPSVKPEFFTVVADYKHRNRKDRSIVPQIIHAPQQVEEVVITPKKVSLRYVRRQ